MRTIRGTLVGLAAVAALLLAGCSDRPTSPTAPPLGRATQAAGISDSSLVVGAFVDPPSLTDMLVSVSGASHGFLLSGGTFTKLEPQGAIGSGASGINSTRQIVGWFSDSVGTHGFLLAHGTFATIDAPGATAGNTNAYGINATGQIVGSFLDATGSHGFLLAAGTFTAIDVPGAAAGTTNAYSINAAGQIVGRVARAHRPRPWF